MCGQLPRSDSAIYVRKLGRGVEVNKLNFEGWPDNVLIKERNAGACIPAPACWATQRAMRTSGNTGTESTHGFDSIGVSDCSCGAPSPRPNAKFCDYCGKQLQPTIASTSSHYPPNTSRSRSPHRKFQDIQLDTTEEDVKNGRALDVEGRTISLEAVFSRMRMALLGETMAYRDVKQEPVEEITGPVQQLLYSQWTCSSRFRGGPYAGRLLHEAIADLTSGNLDPLQDDWLVLDVVRRNARLFSVDNRRLFCLRSWQQQEPERKVLARIRVREWDPVFDRFMLRDCKIVLARYHLVRAHVQQSTR